MRAHAKVLRDPVDKILTLESALELHGRPRKEVLVFTNGCFDLLHRGHVEYLHYARNLGDRLVVGLNGDESVRRLKGAGRPVNTQDDRAAVLAALAAVDGVVLFHEDTPRVLIQALLPDVLVKGGDYRADEIIGAQEVEDAGGKVVIAPLVPGKSTTSILHRAHELPDNG